MFFTIKSTSLYSVYFEPAGEKKVLDWLSFNMHKGLDLFDLFDSKSIPLKQHLGIRAGHTQVPVCCWWQIVINTNASNLKKKTKKQVCWLVFAVFQHGGVQEKQNVTLGDARGILNGMFAYKIYLN